jgi:hypothetical protein
MAHDLGMYGRRWVGEAPVPGETPRAGYVYINAAEAFTCYSGNVPLSPLDQQKVGRVATSLFYIQAGPMLRPAFAAAWEQRFTGQMARVQNAVYYDAVWLVAYGLRSLYASGTIASRVDVDSLSALTLSEAMRAQSFVGMTGPISYDARNTAAANDRRGSDYALYNVLGMNAQCVWGTFVGASNLALQVDPNISLWRLPVFLGDEGDATLAHPNSGYAPLEGGQIPPVSCAAGTYARVNLTAGPATGLIRHVQCVSEAISGMCFNLV